MKIGNLLGGTAIMCAAVFYFWVIFFKLAPWIISTIPDTGWKEFLSIVIYILVGWFGGIAIPIVIFILGIYVVSLGD